MKKLSILSALVPMLLLGACTGSQAKFDVTVLNAEGNTVNVIDVNSGETIASLAGDVEKAELPISGKADKDALLAVQAEGDTWQNMFFNDGTPVTVNLADHSLKGSSLNEKLTAYDLDLDAIDKDYEKLMEEYRALTPEEQKFNINSFNNRAESISSAYLKKIKEIAKDNTDNLIPAAFAGLISQVLEEDEAEAFFAADAPYAKHPATLAAKAQIDEQNARQAANEAAKQEAIGKKFTDLEEPDVDGNMHKLSEYLGKGKWVYVDFWASWCGPCRDEMPNVVAAYEKYHPKGLEIVGLSFDKDKEAWVNGIKKLKMPWIHLSDLKGWQTVASDTYNVKAIPASLLVDPEGIIVARDLRGEALGAKLAEVFGE